MKIELISMQRVYNHGSFLQAYGLKQMLSTYAEDVRFGDIIPGIPNNKVNVKFSEVHDVPKLKHYWIRVLDKLQIKLFQKVQRDVLDIDNKFSVEESKDLAFIGSDEMFNCLAGSPWGISKQLFGAVPNVHSVYTYAVSCGHTTYDKIPVEYHDYLTKAMENLKVISVRDENTAEFVRKLSGREPQYNLDPVLIYDFKKEIKKPKLRKKYLLVYSYSNRICNKREIEQIKKFAKERDLIIVGAGEFQYWCDKNIIVNPFRLLGYFKNAEYVVTDTFHGNVISIKYNKNFATYVRKSNENKLFDLLSRMSLTSRVIHQDVDLESVLSKPIDYKSVNEMLSQEREKTMHYIKECIEGRENFE